MITGYVKFLYTPERIVEKITLQATYADLANNKTTEITESFLGSTLVNLYWLITDIDLVQNLILEKGESGKPGDIAYETAFTDVPEGKWYTNAVLWAFRNGIASGKGNAFDVSGKITREEVGNPL